MSDKTEQYNELIRLISDCVLRHGWTAVHDDDYKELADKAAKWDMYKASTPDELISENKRLKHRLTMLKQYLDEDEFSETYQ